MEKMWYWKRLKYEGFERSIMRIYIYIDTQDHVAVHIRDFATTSEERRLGERRSRKLKNGKAVGKEITGEMIKGGDNRVM